MQTAKGFLPDKTLMEFHPQGKFRLSEAAFFRQETAARVINFWVFHKIVWQTTFFVHDLVLRQQGRLFHIVCTVAVPLFAQKEAVLRESPYRNNGIVVSVSFIPGYLVGLLE
jgi:hypothetical protein